MGIVSSSNFPVATVLTRVVFPAFYKPTKQISNSLPKNFSFNQSNIRYTICIYKNKNKNIYYINKMKKNYDINDCSTTAESEPMLKELTKKIPSNKVIKKSNKINKFKNWT